MTPAEKSDLAYLRALAEEGRTSPLLTGPFALWWGGLAVIALLTHWTVKIGLAPTLFLSAQDATYGAIWAAYGLVGALGNIVLGRLARDKPGATSIGNRADSAVWSAVSILVFVIAAAMVARNALLAELGPDWLRPRPIPELYDVILTVAFGGYAIAYAVSAKMAKAALLSPLSGASYVAAAISVCLIGDAKLYLFAAAFVLVAVVIPGAVLLAREPKSTV